MKLVKNEMQKLMSLGKCVSCDIKRADYEEMPITKPADFQDGTLRPLNRKNTGNCVFSYTVYKQQNIC